MSNEQAVLNEELNRTLSHLDELWEVVREQKWENEQFVLSFLDRVNEYSVRN